MIYEKNETISRQWASGLMVKALDPCGGDQEPLPLRMGPKIGWFDSPLVHWISDSDMVL